MAAHNHEFRQDASHPLDDPFALEIIAGSLQGQRASQRVPHIGMIYFHPFRSFACKGFFACSLVPMGRVRPSSPVSTRPRRPCPLILRSKVVWFCVSFCRTGGIRAWRIFSGNGCDDRRGIRQAVGMVVGSLLGKELQTPAVVLP